MPRKRQRFSRLFRELKAANGAPAPGSDAANFLLFLNGTNDIQQVNKPPAGSKKRYRTSVIPFSLAPPGSATPAASYGVSVSAYSISGRNTRFSSISEADLGWQDEVSGTNKNSNFYPAIFKTVFSRSGATLNPSKKSAVTQENYAYLPKRSFSLPFGRAVAALAEDEYTRKGSLSAEAQTAGALQVSFIPEDFQLEGSGQGVDQAAVIPVT